MTAAHALLDGPYGLEGIFTLTPATFGAPSVAINDQSDPAGYYLLDQVDGVFDAADSEDPREKTPARMGETVYPRQRGGKTITLTGRIIASTLQTLRHLNAAANAAYSAVAPTTLLLRSLIPSSPVYCYFGQPLAYTQSDVQPLGPSALPSAWQRPFVASFRCSDPRCYVLDATATAAAAAGVTGTVALGGYAPTAPTFVILGPTPDGDATPNVTITNHSTGVIVVLNLQSGMLASDVLTVNFASRTADINGVDQTASVNWAQSSWWGEGQEGIYPGSCIVSCAGAGAWSVTTPVAVW